MNPLSIYESFFDEQLPTSVCFSGYGDGILSYSKESKINIWKPLHNAICSKSNSISFDSFGIGTSTDIANAPPLTQDQIRQYFKSNNIFPQTNIYQPIGKTAYSVANSLQNKLLLRPNLRIYKLFSYGIGVYPLLIFASIQKNVKEIILIDPPALNFKALANNQDVYDFLEPIVSENYPKHCTISEIIYSLMQVDFILEKVQSIPIKLIFSKSTPEQMRKIITSTYFNAFFSKKSSYVITSTSDYLIYENASEIVSICEI